VSESTEPVPRLGLRPNPDNDLGYDLYLWDDGNAWTGWLRVELAKRDMRGHPGVLTKDGEQDLIELSPYVGDAR
jgi:hypothetical protein